MRYNQLITAVKQDEKLKWNGDPKNFRCKLCGKPIKENDQYTFFIPIADDRFYQVDDKKKAVENGLIRECCWVDYDTTIKRMQELHNREDEAKQGELWSFMI